MLSYLKQQGTEELEGDELPFYDQKSKLNHAYPKAYGSPTFAIPFVFNYALKLLQLIFNLHSTCIYEDGHYKNCYLTLLNTHWEAWIEQFHNTPIINMKTLKNINYMMVNYELYYTHKCIKLTDTHLINTSPTVIGVQK